MKCYTINRTGKLLKTIDTKQLRPILESSLRKKSLIASAHPKFTPFTPFSLNELKGEPDMFSYGTMELTSRVNPFSRNLPKTAFLLMYEHGKFYPDPSNGDMSTSIWMSTTHTVVMALPGKLALREMANDTIFGVDKNGKLTKYLVN